MKKIFIALLCAVSVLSVGGCSKGDDAEAPSSSSSGGKGSVSITSVTATHSTATNLTTIYVNVQTSGVSGDRIETLGAMCSTNSSVTSGTKGYLRGGKTSGQIKITGLTISRKTKYYVKAFLTTEDGTVYSSVKTVTTP